MSIVYQQTAPPPRHDNYVPQHRNRETMAEHLRLVLEKMQQRKLDTLLIYGDREHGANFAYLCGFEPRFEESVLLLQQDGTAALLLGNENLKMAKYSFLPAQVVHVPHFSLPNQPMACNKTIEQLLEEGGVRNGSRLGVVGWKRFTATVEDKDSLFDVPAFIVDAARRLNRDGELLSASDLFLDERNGLRHIHNANEILCYEYGAGLASSRVLAVMDELAVGKTEIELAELLHAQGQPQTVTTICATGERFTDAVVFPRNKQVELGDKFSLTLGLRGGLSSRAGYVVENREQLPKDVEDYLERVAIPYYRAAVCWYESVGIACNCGELYRRIQQVFPREQYHWSLNPGHYTGQEEWTASPFYEGSDVSLQSGMLLQMDIIPSVSGYGGAGAEDGIALADEALREEIRRQSPEAWQRIQERRRFMIEELGIHLRDEVLPLSDICGYFRPYLLAKDKALKQI